CTRRPAGPPPADRGRPASGRTRSRDCPGPDTTHGAVRRSDVAAAWPSTRSRAAWGARMAPGIVQPSRLRELRDNRRLPPASSRTIPREQADQLLANLPLFLERGAEIVEAVPEAAHDVDEAGLARPQ